jgi:hypothetical protein
MKIYVQYILMFMIYFFNSQTDEDIIALCIRKPFRLQRTTEICMNNLTYYKINFTKINNNLLIQ